MSIHGGHVFGKWQCSHVHQERMSFDSKHERCCKFTCIAGKRLQIVMCWAGPKAQSLPKPGPFEPGPARPIGGLQLGLGRACHMRKPKAWAQARALRI